MTAATLPAPAPRVTRTGVGAACPCCPCRLTPKEPCHWCGRRVCRSCTVRWFETDADGEMLCVWCRECFATIEAGKVPEPAGVSAAEVAAACAERGVSDPFAG